jgi:uncharacterized repeat protein (TIGR01451 family)
LIVEIAGPAQTSIGTAAPFTIYIKNMGTVQADGVAVQALLPEYVDVLEASPQPSLTKANKLSFALGDLAAEEVRKIHLRLVPRRAGAVRLHTSVGFSVATSSTVHVGKPQLSLKCEAPAMATLGDVVTFRLVVENRGDGLSRTLSVVPQVAEAGQNRMSPAGRFDIGTLEPGDSKEILLRAVANHEGPMQVRFVATDDSGAEAATEIRVWVEPTALNVTLLAPDQTRVGMEQDYAIRVTNRQACSAGHVRIACSLPADFRLTVVDNAVKFNPDYSVLTWDLRELPPGATQVLRFKARVASEGAHTLRATLQSDNLPSPQQAEITVDAYDEPQFDRTAST